jgi:hypothetical protein
VEDPRYGFPLSLWFPYLESERVGDVFSLRVFGQVIVILNTSKATKDLLEKRGDIYSDRPVIPIFDM